MSDESLYQLEDQKGRQPVSLAALQQMVHEGEISRYTCLRNLGSGELMTAGQIDSLDFENAPPPKTPTRPTATRTEPDAPPAEAWPENKPAEPVADGITHQAEAQPYGPVAEPSRPRRRFRIGFALATLGLIAIAGAAIWYFLTPSPADRFEQFALAAREKIAAKLDGDQRARFRGDFEYNVRKTDLQESVMVLYQGRIVLWTAKAISEYQYDYRHGKWTCTGVKIHLADGKVTIVKGIHLKTLPEAKILSACGHY